MTDRDKLIETTLRDPYSIGGRGSHLEHKLARALQDCERELGREKEWGRKQADFGIQCAERCDAAEQRVKELEEGMSAILRLSGSPLMADLVLKYLAASPPLEERRARNIDEADELPVSDGPFGV